MYLRLAMMYFISLSNMAMAAGEFSIKSFRRRSLLLIISSDRFCSVISLWVPTIRAGEPSKFLFITLPRAKTYLYNPSLHKSLCSKLWFGISSRKYFCNSTFTYSKSCGWILFSHAPNSFNISLSLNPNISFHRLEK